VQGAGCGVQGAGCRVQSAGCRVDEKQVISADELEQWLPSITTTGAVPLVQGPGSRVQGPGSRLQGAGCRIHEKQVIRADDLEQCCPIPPPTRWDFGFLSSGVPLLPPVVVMEGRYLGCRV
jgi:hypothetical protein